MEETQPVNLELTEGMKTFIYWKEEADKCMRDPWYFYVNYTVDENGNKPTISREEYYEFLNSYKNYSPLKFRGKYK